MYICPNNCVKSESKMLFNNNKYECPVCGKTGKWYPKYDKVKLPDETCKRRLNRQGHPFVEWDDGTITINVVA